MKRNKYGAKKTVLDGITFDSKGEASRYAKLKLWQKAGEIGEIELQPKFVLEVNGQKICTYKADFRYRWLRGPDQGKGVVEDFKGVETAVFKLKEKLMLACHGIVIHKVKAA